ncbi:hypothetical protein BD626DRAFT_572420 [Schizophyllum amplum]|uniref:Uncharacterized protein n=1 Tax=Schizophyllum amplum TaxID=97359 RepID=A0A550C4L9_9AGAR|nr:hypothetical protein BD626DRAFT_572420 [Auriculariopsis ampla]
MASVPERLACSPAVLAFVNWDFHNAEPRALKLKLEDVDHANALAAQSATHSEQCMDQLRLQLADLALEVEVEKLQHDAQASRASDEGNMQMLRMSANVWGERSKDLLQCGCCGGVAVMSVSPCNHAVCGAASCTYRDCTRCGHPLNMPQPAEYPHHVSESGCFAREENGRTCSADVTGFQVISNYQGEVALRTIANMSSVLQRVHELTVEEQLAGDHDLASTSLGPPP